MPERLTIIRGRNGSVHVEAEGFSGNTCLTELDRFLEYARSHGVEIDVTKIKRKEVEVYAADDRSSVDVR
jgi:hypothetical protein